MMRNAVLAKMIGAAAILATLAVVTVPTRPALALDTGAAVGIGLGSFALGSALGATANPYYRPYPYGYYPAPAYYPPPAPYYPPARSCWDPYSRTYYAC